MMYNIGLGDTKVRFISGKDNNILKYNSVDRKY